MKEVKLKNGLMLHEFKLDNGLRVIVVPNHFAPVFTYRTMFFVGSKDEVTGKRGIAHLFEHMMFRETKNLKNGEFDLRITRLGGNKLNAYTHTDRTVYLQSLPSQFLDDITKLEADRMENLILNKDRLEEERGAVLGEYNMYLNSPGRYFFKTINEMLFSKHPYRYEVIGTEEEIKGFTIEDCRKFYQTFYAPNNAVIMVVGDVQPKAVVDTVKKYYGHLSPNKAERSSYETEPQQTSKKVKHVTHAYASQTELGMAVKILDLKEEDIPYFLVLESLLGGQAFSLAYQQLVHKGLATQVSSYFDMNPVGEPSAFYFSATLSENVTTDKIQRDVELLFKRVTSQLMSDQKIQMAVNQVKHQYFADSNEGLAGLIIEGLNYKNNPAYIFDFFYDVFLKHSFSAKHLLNISKKYFLPSRMNLLFLAPQSGKMAENEKKNGVI